MLKSTLNAYGKAARFFHWASAILILAMIPLGLTMTRLPDGDATKSLLYLIHVNLGFAVLILTAQRVIWRFIEPTPAMPSGLSPALQWLFNAIHLGQYIVLIALTSTGTVTFLSTSPLASSFPETAVAIAPVAHSILSKVFVGLLLAHLVGIFQHQFTESDVLSRMGFPKALVNNMPKPDTTQKVKSPSRL